MKDYIFTTVSASATAWHTGGTFASDEMALRYGCAIIKQLSGLAWLESINVWQGQRYVGEVTMTIVTERRAKS